MNKESANAQSMIYAMADLNKFVMHRSVLGTSHKLGWFQKKKYLGSNYIYIFVQLTWKSIGKSSDFFPKVNQRAADGDFDVNLAGE